METQYDKFIQKKKKENKKNLQELLALTEKISLLLLADTHMIYLAFHMPKMSYSEF